MSSRKSLDALKTPKQSSGKKIVQKWITRLNYTDEESAVIENIINSLGHERFSFGESLRNSSKRKRQSNDIFFDYDDCEECATETSSESDSDECNRQLVSLFFFSNYL